jgi:hypothetical protein
LTNDRGARTVWAMPTLALDVLQLAAGLVALSTSAPSGW